MRPYLDETAGSVQEALASTAGTWTCPQGTRPARALVDDVAAVHALRDRVAHLEPLLRAGHVERTVAAARRVLAAIDPTVEQWWVGGQRVSGVLARRPFPPAVGARSVR